MRSGARLARCVAAAAVAVLLAACSTTPTPTDGSGGVKQGGLRPLVRQPSLPPGAPPRSHVPSLRYDLAVPGAGELDDGQPEDPNREVFERGGASWYGIQFHQRKTASGERFDMTDFTAAHRTLPFNTRVCVRSLVNGREVLVRINDRGPYAAGRIIDLSRAAAESIGLVGLGIKQVALSVVDKEDNCAGTPVGEAESPVQDVPETPARAKRKVAPRKRR
ncbi:septal ring lytic transglycosylase RlpA family protein [Variovorax ureilyticus]|uniref:septal ring lytic transglycosylase RlpA family protein n=1 Tax=Variovorax ureilyticus TaxID=1836198 RepID=UPI003D675C66